MFEKRLVLVKGGGDLATGVAYRLFRAGFPVIVTEAEQPTTQRRAVAFAEAVYSGNTEVEGVRARLTSASEAVSLCQEGGGCGACYGAGFCFPAVLGSHLFFTGRPG